MKEGHTKKKCSEKCLKPMPCKRVFFAFALKREGNFRKKRGEKAKKGGCVSFEEITTKKARVHLPPFPHRPESTSERLTGELWPRRDVLARRVDFVGAKKKQMVEFSCMHRVIFFSRFLFPNVPMFRVPRVSMLNII